MTKKFKITKKDKYTVSLVSADKDKQELTIGYSKAILFARVSKLAEGAEVEIDVANSDKGSGYSGRLFAQDNDKFLSAMQRAKEFEIRERNINALLAQGTV